jgi:predicted HTH transcriptional regulator
VVILVIPAAKQVPTAFNNVRFLRIGSSKVNLSKYPERESQLFDILRNGLPTIESVEAYEQDLSFRKLFMYYEDKGIILSKNNFEKNLGLRNKDGMYNLLAQLLSDDSQFPIRVSIFRGEDKTAPLYSVREFGNNCLLNSLDKVLEYGDVLNIMQADEKNRLVQRKEVPLFNQDAFREAMVNAFVHNCWVDGNAPMITVYSNRIEILSRGTLAPKQTINGFYLGESVPVNRKLSDIFLQLHISERSGRGVPQITKIYGRKAFEFRENSIVVTIPFEKVDASAGDKVVDKAGDKTQKLNSTRQRILDEMRNNPNITQPQLMTLIGIGKTAMQSNVSFLRKNGYIERIGANKNGYWKVL